MIFAEQIMQRLTADKCPIGRIGKRRMDCPTNPHMKRPCLLMCVPDQKKDNTNCSTPQVKTQLRKFQRISASPFIA